MIRMPNLTDSFTALESGVFFVDDNICLLGNVAGFFTDTNDNIYTNKRGKDFFEGLYYRFQGGKNIVIIAESDTIQAYRNLFNYMFDTTKYSDRRYNFPQKYAEAITFVDVGLGDDCWIYNKNNIFSLYINYMRDTHMKFDHIIANPPYKFGNPITSAILDNVDFDEYVNLMPVSKYRKDKIYQYIKPNSLVKVIWEGDAATNPQIAVLTKTRDKNITATDFDIWCFDKKFKKFYLENLNRKIFWIHKHETPSYDRVKLLNPRTCFQITARTVQNGIHKTPNCWDYKWNVLLDPAAYTKDEYYQRSLSTFYEMSEIEKVNLTKWWYGSNIWSQVIWGLNQQTGDCIEIIPRVDWTREWTDEEILKDYDYTDEEIKELLK